MWPLALLLAALAAPSAAVAQDLDAQIMEVRTLVRDKRYALALDSLRLIALQLSEVRLDEVRPAFPDPPPGWTATPAGSIVGDEDLWSGRVAGQRTYLRTGGGSRIDLAIDLRSPLAPAVAMSLNPLFVAGDQRGRLVNVGKEQGLLRLFPDTGEADLRIPLGREILVTLTGHGVAGGEALLEFARRVDFALLQARTGQ